MKKIMQIIEEGLPKGSPKLSRLAAIAEAGEAEKEEIPGLIVGPDEEIPEVEIEMKFAEEELKPLPEMEEAGKGLEPYKPK